MQKKYWKQKTFFLIAMLCSVFVSSQKSVDDNWDLLFNNEREKARNYFDEHFESQKNTNFELLLLDAMIDEQLGQYNFDNSFISTLNKLKIDEGFLYPMMYHNFMFKDLDDYGIDDFTFEKVDLLAKNPLYKNSSTVLSLKLSGNLYRKNYKEAQKTLSKAHIINQWQRAGVFENLNGSGLDTVYEPETYANNDKLFNANSLGMVGWYNPKFKNNEYFEYLLNESEYGDAIVYAQTFVENPKERRVILQVSINSDYKVFVNDQEIFVSNRNGYSSPSSQFLEFTLPKGTNRLLYKISVGKGVIGFMGAFRDTKDQTIPDLKYDDTYKEYNRNTLETLNFKEVKLPFEKLLTQKVAENPSKYFYKYLLINGYLNNSQNEQAKELLDQVQKKYPSSTLFRVLETKYYQNLKETAKRGEVEKKIQNEDPDYYLSTLLKMNEGNFFDTATLPELEEMRDKLSKTKAVAFTDLFNVFIAAKNRDLEGIKLFTQKMKEEFHNSDKMFPAVVTMENINNVGKTETIKSYEKFLETRLNPTILKTLQNLYKNANQLDLYTQLTDEYIQVYPNFNPLRKDKLDILYADFKNPEIEKELDNCIANFPYSYSALAAKADYLAKTNRREEAVEYAKKSLSHYSANQTMQSLIRDLENKESDLQKVGLQNIEEYVKKNRNTPTKGSDGVTVLYDEYIAEVLQEGGYKSRTTILYEITSEKGINELKEYYFDGGENMIKSEVIKKNGKIVPGEKSYSQVVFTNLEVGDVLVIQSEGKSSQTGRFYKDFFFYSYFALGYPGLESVLTVITPKDVTYNYKANNGDFPYTEKIENGKKYRTWRVLDVPELVTSESYSKNYYDRAKSITVSSIKSWKEIADWYSDLIRKNLVFDKTTEKAFHEIFPNGFAGLNDKQKAFKIYEYIEKNINYSSVDFRQSGYIPQKPSKTLVSKLGDCKDLSTLFVMFAQEAGLEANLVLVRTTDLDDNSLILPNVNFNHCIVEVKLDGKITYMEMTDKFLPFNSVSKNIYHAKALVINIDKDKNKNVQLFEIPDNNNEKMSYKTLTEAQFNGDKIIFNTTQFVQGSTKSYFSDFFSGEKTDEEMKNYFEDDFGSRLNEILRVKSVSLISGKDVTNNPLVYEIGYEANENLQSLGNLRILKIPFLTKPFTKDIISLEKRTSDIKYIYYENQNQYEEEIRLNLPENSEFVEIPKNKKFKFRDFVYSISYKLVKPNQLTVIRKSDTSWENITKEEYVDFRGFVEKVLNAENQVLGYKTRK